MIERDNTVSLPVQIFGEAYPYQLPPGALFNFRGHWAIRVAYSDAPADQAFLILQGPHAGLLRYMSRSMPRALCVSSSFTWFAAVDPGDPAGHEALQSASIAISEGGPVIVGGDEEGDHYAFNLAGQCWADYPSATALTRFDRWSVQVALKEGPFRSLGMLFSVDRRAGRGSA